MKCYTRLHQSVIQLMIWIRIQQRHIYQWIATNMKWTLVTEWFQQRMSILHSGVFLIEFQHIYQRNFCSLWQLSPWILRYHCCLSDSITSQLTLAHIWNQLSVTTWLCIFLHSTRAKMIKDSGGKSDDSRHLRQTKESKKSRIQVLHTTLYQQKQYFRIKIMLAKLIAAIDLWSGLMLPHKFLLSLVRLLLVPVT